MGMKGIILKCRKKFYYILEVSLHHRKQERQENSHSKWFMGFEVAKYDIDASILLENRTHNIESVHIFFFH